uniref:TSUP family transporter n=1 Tax=uncultured Paracoccus sp. TaxID=189685 RepID=UPI0025FC9B3D
MLEALLLFVAGFLGGMLNAVAGGGTFITFPALVFIGIPPVVANASSTIAALPGYLSAAVAFRGDIRRIQHAPFARLTIWTMI